MAETTETLSPAQRRETLRIMFWAGRMDRDEYERLLARLDTEPTNTNPAWCEHCGQPVTFGPTEHGYRGFVHTSTRTTACPPRCEAHGPMEPRPAERVTPTAAWCGDWFDCPVPTCHSSHLFPSAALLSAATPKG